jgi:hypothetical protein
MRWFDDDVRDARDIARKLATTEQNQRVNKLGNRHEEALG